jgi:hypothetical protein
VTKRGIRLFVKSALVGSVLGVAFAVYEIAFLWPSYDWDLRLTSPDGQYDAIVIRRDKAAFDDFSYRIYVFPHTVVPKDQAKDSRVWMTWTWRDKKYLVYDSYNYPTLRWTGPHSMEIDLTEFYYGQLRYRLLT